jgi:hypothetical protein
MIEYSILKELNSQQAPFHTNLGDYQFQSLPRVGEFIEMSDENQNYQSVCYQVTAVIHSANPKCIDSGDIIVKQVCSASKGTFIHDQLGRGEL